MVVVGPRRRPRSSPSPRSSTLWARPGPARRQGTVRLTHRTCPGEAHPSGSQSKVAPAAASTFRRRRRSSGPPPVPFRALTFARRLSPPALYGPPFVDDPEGRDTAERDPFRWGCVPAKDPQQEREFEREEEQRDKEGQDRVDVDHDRERRPASRTRRDRRWTPSREGRRKAALSEQVGEEGVAPFGRGVPRPPVRSEPWATQRSAREVTHFAAVAAAAATAINTPETAGGGTGSSVRDRGGGRLQSQDELEHGRQDLVDGGSALRSQVTGEKSRRVSEGVLAVRKKWWRRMQEVRQTAVFPA